MKATQLVCTFLLALLFVGCRIGPSDKKAPDVLLHNFWASANVHEFIIPVRTPYDDDREARQDYLQGYEAGIREGIGAKQSNKWHTGDVFYTNAGTMSEPFTRGWRDAAAALLEREAHFLDEMNREKKSGSGFDK